MFVNILFVLFVCFLSSADRLNGAIVRIGNDADRNNPICGTVSSEQIANGPEITLLCTDISGQYLSIELPGSNFLTLCEVKVFGKEQYSGK